MSKELRLPRVNSIVISGRLTKDIELKYTTNETPVAKLSLAFDRSYQKDGEWQQETSYIDIVVWSKRAEQCAEFLHKGSPILVEGYLKTRTYVDKDNQNRKITEIVGSRISFLEKEVKPEPEQTETTPEKSTLHADKLPPKPEEELEKEETKSTEQPDEDGVPFV